MYIFKHIEHTSTLLQSKFFEKTLNRLTLLLEWPAGTRPAHAEFCGVSLLNFVESECWISIGTLGYIDRDLGTITSKFHDVAGFRVMRNIIPNTSSDLEQSGTSRKLFVFESRAVIFSVTHSVTWLESTSGEALWKPASAGITSQNRGVIHSYFMTNMPWISGKFRNP